MITTITTRKSLFALASAFVLMLPVALAQAVTRNVPSQYTTIQAAINASVAGDTIVVAAGNYSITSTINWVGKNLTIRGAGPGKSVIQSDGFTRCLETQNLTAASRIEGFTFFNGFQAGGGGMCNTDSSLTVANCEFSFNEGGWGAGMFNRGGSPTILNCNFHNNVATYDAGGMYNDSSSATVIGCTFDDNFAGQSGGGMFNDHGSNTLVTNCVFRNHQVFDGGGMANSSNSSPRVTNCVFFNNMAFNDGGGMHNYINSRPTVTNCTFVQNQALDNFGSGHGGAIFSHYVDAPWYSSATVTNCIIWNNTAEGGSPAIHGNANVSYSIVQGLPYTSPYSPNGNFAADPLFLDAANGNFRLRPNSPARDWGNNAVLQMGLFPLVNGVPVDLDSNPRLGWNWIDRGAYEFHQPTNVSNQVSVTRLPALISSSGSVMQPVILRNTGSTTINGPISLVLTGPNGYTLANRTGVTLLLTPAGRSYINATVNSLAPGASVTITLQFTKTGIGAFSYSTQVFAGLGSR